MVEDIISYGEMCVRENGAALQHGMNFQLSDSYSVILMSRSSNAPYRDKFEDEGGTSITSENVQILCARRNLQKSDDIV